MRLISEQPAFSLAPSAPGQSANRPSQDRPSFFHVDQIGGAAFVTIHVLSLRERQATLVAPQLKHVASRSGWNLVVDISGVVDFTSSWLNVLMHVAADCKARGGGLVLLGAAPVFETLVANSGLGMALPVAKNPMSALAKLGLSPVSPWRLAVASLLEIPVALPVARPWTLADWGNIESVYALEEDGAIEVDEGSITSINRAAA